VRVVDLATGATVRRTPNKAAQFGEGIEIVGDKLVQLTWRENVLLEYSLPDLMLLREVPVRFGREGWGIASDGELPSQSSTHRRPVFTLAGVVPRAPPRPPR